jgi:hypothetical protein
MIKFRTAIALVASIGLLVLAPGMASAMSTTWNPQPTPANDHQPLNSISCSGSKNCYATGQVNGTLNSVIYHFDGTAWTKSATIINATLWGISCPVAGSCIAVGWYNTSGNGGTDTNASAWILSSSRWTRQKTYQPKSTVNALIGIRCSGISNCTAVGYHGNCNPGTCGVVYPLAEHWDGSTWAQESTKGSLPASLDSVGCSSDGTCEAVGYNLFSGAQIAMHWNGTIWSDQTVPQESGGNRLKSVSCNQTTSCMAVGYTDNGTSHQDLVEIWDGTQWTAQPVGNLGPGISLFSVHCFTIDSCTVVGSNGNNAYVATWNGSVWTKNIVNGGAPGILFGLACSSFACTAVGSHGGNSLAERN